MAQEVEFFENFTPTSDRGIVAYSEGPFVICNPMGNGWRIEEQGAKCSILPGSDDIFFIEHLFEVDCKTRDRRLIKKCCDFLNALVKSGQLVLRETHWNLTIPRKGLNING